MVVCAVFKVFSQDRVLRHLLNFQLVLQMTRLKGFFRSFPEAKKSATLPARSGSALPPHSSPWTPAAYGVPMALDEEEEPDEAEEVEEVASEVEYVECTGGGGGNSGTRRCSGSAGGSLRLMALSSATPSGGLRVTLLDVPVTMLDKFQQSWFPL